MQVRAKKHLGQHFLTDQNIARRIVDSLLDRKSSNAVIEVGPGTGVLTQFLLQDHSENFFAMDVDTESVAFLQKKYPASANKIILGDFLNYNIDTLTTGKYDIIGNFPYNISSQILFRALEYKNRVDYVVGMFQKEVAERIAEKPGSKAYGIISVLLQAYYDIEYLFTVEPTVFNPPPKVKSAVIRLTRNKVQRLDCDEVLFVKVVKAGFNQRRKTLRNALRPLITNPEFMSNEILDKRAERLSVEDFVYITNELQKK
ncbi:MAG: 16S rRNA (adenine(1518)-N(6)/adenine(1519)-N(6))-dimethyltransferase RsmA [Bacteroidia bacterium]